MHKKNFTYLFLSIISAFLALTCCRRHDDRLSEISGMVSDHPQDALASLEGIDRNSLSEADGYLYDLLMVKASDKAYIEHSSDSIILKVVDWYARHQDSGLYPEALYYAGRVYSDLGDYPTALRYFRMSLDNLKEAESSGLYSAVVSQTGRLLNTLRLYGDAVGYIQKSIEINMAAGDTVNAVYNLQLLAHTLMSDGRLPEAEKAVRESLAMTDGLVPRMRAKSDMYLAEIKYREGKTDSALSVIRHTPDAVNPIARNSALYYAAKIYLAAGILDTAYMYAREIVDGESRLHKDVAYHLLLSPDLEDFVDIDSARRYILDYRDEIESLYDDNENQLVLMQESVYNYDLHEREKDKALHDKVRLQWWIIVILVAFFSFVIYFFYQENKKKKLIISLYQALDKVDKQKCQQDSMDKEAVLIGTVVKAEELRDRLRNELLSLSEKYEDRSVPIPAVILDYDVYRRLMAMVKEGDLLHDKDDFWVEVEKIVLAASPDFIKNLNLLTNGKISLVDWQTALLLKCGLTPKQLSILFMKSNGAIVSRREMLSLKIFGRKIGVKALDSVIRLL